MSDQTKPKTTVYLGDRKCYCGLSGELKPDFRAPTTRYSIEHHRRSGVGWSDHSSKRTKKHYIGDKFMLGITL